MQHTPLPAPQQPVAAPVQRDTEYYKRRNRRIYMIIGLLGASVVLVLASGYFDEEPGGKGTRPGGDPFDEIDDGDANGVIRLLNRIGILGSVLLAVAVVFLVVAIIVAARMQGQDMHDIYAEYGGRERFAKYYDAWRGNYGPVQRIEHLLATRNARIVDTSLPDKNKEQQDIYLEYNRVDGSRGEINLTRDIFPALIEKDKRRLVDLVTSPAVFNQDILKNKLFENNNVRFQVSFDPGTFKLNIVKLNTATYSEGVARSVFRNRFEEGDFPNSPAPLLVGPEGEEVEVRPDSKYTTWLKEKMFPEGFDDFWEFATSIMPRDLRGDRANVAEVDRWWDKFNNTMFKLYVTVHGNKKENTKDKLEAFKAGAVFRSLCVEKMDGMLDKYNEIPSGTRVSLSSVMDERNAELYKELASQYREQQQIARVDLNVLEHPENYQESDDPRIQELLELAPEPRERLIAFNKAVANMKYPVFRELFEFNFEGFWNQPPEDREAFIPEDRMPDSAIDDVFGSYRRFLVQSDGHGSRTKKRFARFVNNYAKYWQDKDSTTLEQRNKHIDQMERELERKTDASNDTTVADLMFWRYHRSNPSATLSPYKAFVESLKAQGKITATGRVVRIKYPTPKQLEQDMDKGRYMSGELDQLGAQFLALAKSRYYDYYTYVRQRKEKQFDDEEELIRPPDRLARGMARTREIRSTDLPWVPKKTGQSGEKDSLGLSWEDFVKYWIAYKNQVEQEGVDEKDPTRNGSFRQDYYLFWKRFDDYQNDLNNKLFSKTDTPDNMTPFQYWLSLINQEEEELFKINGYHTRIRSVSFLRSGRKGRSVVRPYLESSDGVPDMDDEVVKEKLQKLEQSYEEGLRHFKEQKKQKGQEKEPFEVASVFGEGFRKEIVHNKKELDNYYRRAKRYVTENIAPRKRGAKGKESDAGNDGEWRQAPLLKTEVATDPTKEAKISRELLRTIQGYREAKHLLAILNKDYDKGKKHFQRSKARSPFTLRPLSENDLPTEVNSQEELDELYRNRFRDLKKRYGIRGGYVNLDFDLRDHMEKMGYRPGEGLGRRGQAGFTPDQIEEKKRNLKEAIENLENREKVSHGLSSRERDEMGQLQRALAVLNQGRVPIGTSENTDPVQVSPQLNWENYELEMWNPFKEAGVDRTRSLKTSKLDVPEMHWMNQSMSIESLAALVAKHVANREAVRKGLKKKMDSRSPNFRMWNSFLREEEAQIQAKINAEIVKLTQFIMDMQSDPRDIEGRNTLVKRAYIERQYVIETARKFGFAIPTHMTLMDGNMEYEIALDLPEVKPDEKGRRAWVQRFLPDRFWVKWSEDNEGPFVEKTVKVSEHSKKNLSNRVYVAHQALETSNYSESWTRPGPKSNRVILLLRHLDMITASKPRRGYMSRLWRRTGNLTGNLVAGEAEAREEIQGKISDLLAEARSIREQLSREGPAEKISTRMRRILVLQHIVELLDDLKRRGFDVEDFDRRQYPETPASFKEMHERVRDLPEDQMNFSGKVG